jgi:hypothetical protein
MNNGRHARRIQACAPRLHDAVGGVFRRHRNPAQRVGCSRLPSRQGGGRIRLRLLSRDGDRAAMPERRGKIDQQVLEADPKRLDPVVGRQVAG